MANDFEYTYEIPAGFIEIDPVHYEKVGLTGFVKESTLNFFLKVENDKVLSSISVNRDAFLDEENTYDSLLELNITNLKNNGFEVLSKVETVRNDGTRLTICHVTSQNIKLISTFTTVGTLFVGSSIVNNGKEAEDTIIKFMKSIRIK